MMTENEMQFQRTFSFTDIFVCAFDVVKIMQRAKNVGGGLSPPSQHEILTGGGSVSPTPTPEPPPLHYTTGEK
jgi:hypothetical protein